MNRRDRGILIGMLLGDGCIKLKRHTKKDGKKSVYAEFVMSHCPKQLRYLQYKASKLHSILGGKPLKVSKGKYTLSNGRSYDSYRVSRCNKYFRILHRWAYSNNGKKLFTRKLLNKLTPEGIAYWYMDDGSLVKQKNKAGEISSFAVRLYTYCSLEEAETIQEYFIDVHNIHFKISKYTNKEQYNLRTNTSEGKKFLKLISSYSIPCMDYKFLLLHECEAS